MIIEVLMIKQMMKFMLNILFVQTIWLWNEKMEDKKLILKAVNIFTSLKTDSNSVLFSEEKIDERLLKKLKKSKYAKDSLMLKLINPFDIKLDNEDKVPTRGDYVEKREIGR